MTIETPVTYKASAESIYDANGRQLAAYVRKDVGCFMASAINDYDPKSAPELIAAALSLADKFYTYHGYVSRPGFRYDQSPHPMERLMFDLACEAFEQIRGTDIENAIAEEEE